MAVEPKRGCGFRKVGGLYLVGGGVGMPCDRLPIPLTVCPVCSHGFKQSRGWTWIDVSGLTGGVHRDCKDDFPCPLCMATSDMGKAGLLWIGERFYKTPSDFNKEGAALGISRRIKAIPRGFIVGETWILLAHPKTIKNEGCPGCEHAIGSHSKGGCVADGCECMEHPPTHLPAIFKVWLPSKIEKIIPESQRNTEEAKELIARGITPVFVPDNDPDHQGTVYDSEEEDEEVA